MGCGPSKSLDKLNYEITDTTAKNTSQLEIISKQLENELYNNFRLYDLAIIFQEHFVKERAEDLPKEMQDLLAMNKEQLQTLQNDKHLLVTAISRVYSDAFKNAFFYADKSKFEEANLKWYNISAGVRSNSEASLLDTLVMMRIFLGYYDQKVTEAINKTAGKRINDLIQYYNETLCIDANAENTAKFRTLLVSNILSIMDRCFD